jgi:hypothetical protein
MQHATTEIDDAFIGRVYKTSAYAWAFVVLILLSFLRFYAAAGWTLGSIFSFGTLWSLQWIIPKIFVPEASPRAKRDLAKFSALKLLGIAVILGFVVWIAGRSAEFVFAFCAGVVLTQAVIFLKVLGMLICQHSND